MIMSPSVIMIIVVMAFMAVVMFMPMMMAMVLVSMVVVVRMDMPVRTLVWLERRHHLDALEPMLRQQSFGLRPLL